MPPTILGLDIGGANLKAATADRRAATLPFALWKQPDRLPSALAELTARFPDALELAVTMTGELCDCFETKREGVAAIIKSVRGISDGRPIRVWSTDGVFVDSEEATRDPMKVAAANWHALATLAGQSIYKHLGVMIDTGSTTTDIVPLLDGVPVPRGKTDYERLKCGELIYTGVRRTPVCAILRGRVAAELFATSHDVYLLLGKVAEAPNDCDTADGRPATRACAHNRMSHMLGGDAETISLEDATSLATDVMVHQQDLIGEAIATAIGYLRRTRRPHGHDKKKTEEPIRFLICGSGEFLLRQLLLGFFTQHTIRPDDIISMEDRLGPAISACAAAYAVAVLASESRP